MLARDDANVDENARQTEKSERRLDLVPSGRNSFYYACVILRVINERRGARDQLARSKTEPSLKPIQQRLSMTLPRLV